MSDNSLPDEILSEILSPALKVPDEAFSDNYSRVSPFATFTESPSAYLLVNKAWLRVSTPLIYRVVVLRSAPQAKALARALSKNPDLARFIKKLRLEGAYGLTLQTVLQQASNISELFISLDIYATDNTEGLCRGLQLINPTRLILHQMNDAQRPNKRFKNLVQALLDVFPKWDRLVSLSLPSDPCHKTSKLIRSLNKYERLKRLTVEHAYDASTALKTFWACPIREIVVKELVTRRARQEFNQDRRLKAVVRYERMPERAATPQISPSLNPFFVPLANASPETRSLVWSRVLEFAMAQPGKPKVPFLLVSKTFYELGLPYFYSVVTFRQFWHIHRFASILEAHPTLGARIRGIRGHMLDESENVHEEYQDDGSYAPQPPRDANLAAMGSILSRTTQLEEISFIRSSNERSYRLWDHIRSRGALRDVYVKLASGEEGEAADVDALKSFTALETLCWRSSDDFNLHASPATSTLLRLRCLKFEDASDSAYTALASLNLPSLRTLSLGKDHIRSNCKIFLVGRGHLLTELEIFIWTAESFKESILDLCPNLETLHINWESPCSQGWKEPPKDLVLRPTTPAHKLRKMAFALGWSYFDRTLRSGSTIFKENFVEWRTYVADLPVACMPNLEELQIRGFTWPTTQRQLAKFEWVPVADKLLEAGVGLSDNKGNKWRARLGLKSRHDK
ncbi:hypothetical protein MKEN_00852400 [Mycena kentingensis (nom. inval.)]|nr:hypothetical protein MKEN_00852400 [Mycena kentingensis (nom. inval.)]